MFAAWTNIELFPVLVASCHKHFKKLKLKATNKLYLPCLAAVVVAGEREGQISDLGNKNQILSWV